MANTIDYAACIANLYPTAILNTDYNLVDYGDGCVVIENWNTTKLGALPDMSTVENESLLVAQIAACAAINVQGDSEVENGCSGYTTQGLATNLKICSGRPDLNNMQNLLAYCQQTIIAFTSGSCEPPLGNQLSNSTASNTENSWSGIVNSINVTSGSWATGDAAGSIYFSGSAGTLNVGDSIYDTTATETMILTVVAIPKANILQTAIADFNGNFHVVSMADLTDIIYELQAYGLWLYSNKWTKQAAIMACTSIDQVSAITFF